MATVYTNNSTNTDALIVEKEISSISSHSPSKEELRAILSCVDLTSLEGKDTDEVIQTLCKKAVSIGVAAVCVYPSLVKAAKSSLKDSSVKIAAVAGGFPSGQLPLQLRLEEVKYALDEGADEIDMVISRREFLQKNYSFTKAEVAAAKALCGKATLKVILETGELGTEENIALASRLAMEGGADFIKTSTGKTSLNATLPHVYIMLKEIKKQYEQTGKRVGIKPAGGISDGITAVKFLRLTEQLAGKEWIKPSLFRIGASRLADTLLNELQEYEQNNQIPVNKGTTDGY
jgi:deoxyribose-phosphate aldolase